jgi:hypothetical protein
VFATGVVITTKLFTYVMIFFTKVSKIIRYFSSFGCKYLTGVIVTEFEKLTLTVVQN